KPATPTTHGRWNGDRVRLGAVSTLAQFLVPNADRQAAKAPRASKAPAQESAPEHEARHWQDDAQHRQRATGMACPQPGIAKGPATAVDRQGEEKDHLRFDD